MMKTVYAIWWQVLMILALTLSFAVAQRVQQPLVIDACEDSTAWKSFQSIGVVASLHQDRGVAGNCIRLDVAFPQGSGYGSLVRNLNLPLPANFGISFSIRATVPVNNFEIKVSTDSSGENIWWQNNKNFSYPRLWTRIHSKRRHFSFAWGPKSNAVLDTLRRLEFVVTAGTGGVGSVWIDDIRLRTILPLPRLLPRPTVRASSSAKGTTPENVLPMTAGSWESRTVHNAWIEIDYKYPHEFGGVDVVWDQSLSDVSYVVLGSLDGKAYDTLRTVLHGNGGRRLLFTPESEARFLRIATIGTSPERRFRLEEISLVPSDSLGSVNQWLEQTAARVPRGMYPRYFLREQSYWTVVGAASDEKEALFNEDGAFEVDRQRFSVEPFIHWSDGKVQAWADGTEQQTLENGYLPIPTVVRRMNDAELTITLAAIGDPQSSALLARYQIKNTSTTQRSGTLYLTLRPFQVNPTSQWLNYDGGWARTDSIILVGQRAIVGDKRIIVSRMPSAVGATPFDAGEIVERISENRFPTESTIFDPSGLASAAFAFDFKLEPRESTAVIAAVPFHPQGNRWNDASPSEQEWSDELAKLKLRWENKLNKVQFKVPSDAQHLIDVVRSNIAYVLINKDGPGFQPGSRAYERSWIRDGSMTSAALLKFGLNDEVRRFVEWYASYQRADGSVPCVVDKRGPDPVPEHDSHGELIFACTEYARFTGDTTFLRNHFSNIVAAAAHIQALRATRMTEEYRNGPDTKRISFGLLPESISHEGYSAKPMHSYWDDFFALKGLKDAAYSAARLSLIQQSYRYDSMALAFRHDVYQSIQLTSKTHNIDYVPGCAELGDFDPTSTSIALHPCGEGAFVPQPAYDRTFEKYFRWFGQRAADSIAWDAYTPYELRNVGTFVYLQQKQRAHQLLEWFMNDQRPRGWNQWAEVVWHDSRKAKFIGDMPHTWVGSDFITAVRSMFVYEIDDASTLVVGAGLKDEWILHGISVGSMPTHFGELSMSIRADDPSHVIVQLEGSVNAAQTHILLSTGLLSRTLRSAALGNHAIQPDHGFVRVMQLPATIELNY
ncbi:MAG: discoidin domain-containing protein [Ignavibacteriales bacterium]|nr:discoidin domain-containing protein [Ignavibacteriales bacterium]